MTTKEAKTLVRKIKYASFTDAVRIMKDLEIKKPEYQWVVKHNSVNQ